MTDTTPSQLEKAKIAAFLMNYGIKPVPGALVDELAAWNTRANADARLVEALRALLDAAERHIFGEECQAECDNARAALAKAGAA